MARVLLVDDQPLMLEAYKVFLQTAGDMEVVGEARDGARALEAVAQLTPDVVVMDLAMPVMDGIEATRRITTMFPDVRVMVVTTFASPESLVPALRAGAHGYLLKDCRPEELVGGIRDVLADRSPIAPSLTGALVEAVRHDGGPLPPRAPRSAAPLLTDREQEVIDLLAQGLSNAEISKELFISEPAVKSRLAQVTHKLGVSSRVQVVVRACELGLVQPRLRRD